LEKCPQVRKPHFFTEQSTDARLSSLSFQEVGLFLSSKQKMLSNFRLYCKSQKTEGNLAHGNAFSGSICILNWEKS